MTWNEYFDLIVEGGATPELAQMSIGHMMELYDSYDRDAVVPFEIKEG